MKMGNMMKTEFYSKDGKTKSCQTTSLVKSPKIMKHSLELSMETSKELDMVSAHMRMEINILDILKKIRGINMEFIYGLQKRKMG